MKLNFHKVDLLSLLKNMHKDFSSEAKEKNIAFNFSYENEKYYINGDEDKLKQVFINLIDNAIKFPNKGGEIDINLSKNDDKITVEIKDTGIGISNEDMPYVFERLYRGDKSRHETEGSGIGLTIVKSILDPHLATIDIKSKEGEGTSVQLSF